MLKRNEILSRTDAAMRGIRFKRFFIISQSLSAYIYIMINITLTELIGKNVICLSGGDFVGTVENAVTDRALKKITHLLVFSEERDSLTAIPFSNISAFVNNAVVVKKPPDYNLEIPDKLCPLKAAVYSHDGMLLGVLSDISVNEKFEICRLERDGEQEILRDSVVSFSANVLLICEDAALSKKLKASSKPAAAKRLPALRPKLKRNEILFLEPGEEPDAAIRNIVPELNYLLGRKIIRNIYIGETELAARGDTVSAKHIEICRRHGKIVQLAKYSE